MCWVTEGLGKTQIFFWLKLSGGLGQNGSNTKGNSGLGVYGDMFQPSALTVFLELCSLSHTKNL